jgi:hypothetical protein
MAAIPEEQRIEELRRLGVSEPLIRLSSGDCVHSTFRDNCLGPPYYTYHMADPPTGPLFAPLWDHCDTVVGVWVRPDGLEFIEYDIEAEDRSEFESLARTEQGFWATRFDFIYECDVPVSEMQEAAAAVGFRFLDRHLASRETNVARLNTYDGHRAWLRELVTEIDRKITEAEPDAHPPTARG